MSENISLQEYSNEYPSKYLNKNEQPKYQKKKKKEMCDQFEEMICYYQSVSNIVMFQLK